MSFAVRICLIDRVMDGITLPFLNQNTPLFVENTRCSLPEYICQLQPHARRLQALRLHFPRSYYHHQQVTMVLATPNGYFYMQHTLGYRACGSVAIMYTNRSALLPCNTCLRCL